MAFSGSTIYFKLGENEHDLIPKKASHLHSSVFVFDYPAPYQMVGINAFDTQHLAPIHYRQLLGNAEVKVISKHEMSIRYQAKVVGENWRDRIFRTLGLKEVDVDIRCSGGNFLIFQHHKVQANTHFTLMPIDDQSTRIFMVTSRLKSENMFKNFFEQFWVELQHALIVNFAKEDFRALWHSNYEPNALLEGVDDAMKAWVEHYQQLPRTEVIP